MYHTANFWINYIEMLMHMYTEYLHKLLTYLQLVYGKENTF